MSDSEWGPVWKEAVEECPHYDLISSFVQPWPFEISGNDSDYPYRRRRCYFPLRKFKKFLKQVRESRGYDIEFWAPDTFLYPMSVSSIMKFDDKKDAKDEKEEKEEKDEEDDEDHHNWALRECEIAVSKINEEAKLHGERYVLFKLLKVLNSILHQTTLYTFTVREVSRRLEKTVQASVFSGPPIKLNEWRFKPGSVVTYSSDQDGEEPRYTSSDHPDTDPDPGPDPGPDPDSDYSSSDEDYCDCCQFNIESDDTD